MKICLLMSFSLLLGHSAEARRCTQKDYDRGCYEDEIECNKPTHYSCPICVCPSKPEGQFSNDSNVISPDVETEVYEFIENGFTGTKCRFLPRTGDHWCCEYKDGRKMKCGLYP